MAVLRPGERDGRRAWLVSGSGRSGRGFAAQVRRNGGLVELVHELLFHDDGALRAVSEAGAETVAEIFGDQSRLAVHELQGALGAVGDAIAAAVAFLFVNPDDLSCDSHR